MKFGLSILIMLVLVPFQVTLLDSMSIAGIRPDLCLIAACVGGFWFGPVFGLILGLTVGFGQDLFSGGELWLNLLVKGAVGLLSGFLSKNLTNATPGSIFLPMIGVSIFSGVVFLVSSRPGDQLGDFFDGVPTIILPQALFNGLVSIVVNWGMKKWITHELEL